VSEARPGGARREAVRPSSSVVGLADERMTEGGGLASEVSVVRSATAVKSQGGKVETVAGVAGRINSRSVPFCLRNGYVRFILCTCYLCLW